MGVNSGAFVGILLCGYLGEQIGWSWGFGGAGIFMLFGLIQFWLAQNIFGDIGLKPDKTKKEEVKMCFRKIFFFFALWKKKKKKGSSTMHNVRIISSIKSKQQLHSYIQHHQTNKQTTTWHEIYK